jgi:hypothetical protein
MKKYSFLVVACLALLVAGCATTGPVKGSASSNAIYTDASRQIAFDAANDALAKLGYKIDLKDQENFFVKGSYWNPLTGYQPLVAEIDVTQETSGAKIVYSIDQAGTIKQLDITGYYPRCLNNIYNEINKILVQKGYKAQKSR